MKIILKPLKCPKSGIDSLKTRLQSNYLNNEVRMKHPCPLLDFGRENSKAVGQNDETQGMPVPVDSLFVNPQQTNAVSVLAAKVGGATIKRQPCSLSIGKPSNLSSQGMTVIRKSPPRKAVTDRLGAARRRWNGGGLKTKKKLSKGRRSARAPVPVLAVTKGGRKMIATDYLMTPLFVSVALLSATVLAFLSKSFPDSLRDGECSGVMKIFGYFVAGMAYFVFNLGQSLGREAPSSTPSRLETIKEASRQGRRHRPTKTGAIDRG